MDRQERLHRRRELYRLKRAEETPQEREVRLARREKERVRRATLSAERRQSILDLRNISYLHTYGWFLSVKHRPQKFHVQ